MFKRYKKYAIALQNNTYNIKIRVAENSHRSTAPAGSNLALGGQKSGRQHLPGAARRPGCAWCRRAG